MQRRSHLISVKFIVVRRDQHDCRHVCLIADYRFGFFVSSRQKVDKEVWCL
jgi:hypothetical protein